jgi:hypothetical protein
MFHGGNPEAVVDRPISGGYVSRDYPFQEIGNHEFGSPGDERSGLSMVETPKQSWTVRFKEATCREITHFGKTGITNSKSW